MASVQGPTEGEGIKSSHDDFEDVDLSDPFKPSTSNASAPTSSDDQDGMEVTATTATGDMGGQVEEDHGMNGFTEEQPSSQDPSTNVQNGSAGDLENTAMLTQDVNGHVYEEMNGTSGYDHQGIANGVNGDSEGDEMMQDMDEETDQEIGETNPDLGKRVKVYELREQSWFDRGTGHCKGIYDDTQDLALLIVEPEETPEKAEEGQGGFLKDELLLSARVEKDDIYSRQQEDTLIVWTEPATSLDIALSFQDAEGCEDIWGFICEVQRHLNNLPSDADVPSSSSPGHSPVLGVAQVNQMGEQRATWAIPSLANIREQSNLLKMQSRSAPGRERAVEHILSEDYIKNLISVFKQAEDLESLEDLHALCGIVQTIIMYNDNGILEYILQDDVFTGVIGMLEYDPEFPSLKASFRQFFAEISKFRQVVEIKDQNIRNKIHQTYRLHFLKEVVLARLLDDPTFGILNGFIFFNQVDIVAHIQNNDPLLLELFGYFMPDSKKIGVSTGNGDDATDGGVVDSEIEEKRRNTVLFLHQLMSMGKSIQVPSRLALYRNLMDRGLLSVIEWSFSSSSPSPSTSQGSTGGAGHVGILHAGAEMLTWVVEHDVISVRTHIMKEVDNHNTSRNPHSRGESSSSNTNSTGGSKMNGGMINDKKSLVEYMIEMMVNTENMGLLSQMLDTFRTLLEAPSENDTFSIKTKNPTSDVFITYFYDCASLLFQPLLDLPEITSDSNPAFHPDRRQATRLLNLIELLSFCVVGHQHRASFYILSNPICKKVVSLLYFKDKPLRHATLRFYKSCLKVGNHFIHRHFVKNELLPPLIWILEEESSRDNMLSSACMDILELIRKDNIKPIINQLYGSYKPRLDGLLDRPFFRASIKALHDRWEQINEPPPAPSSDLTESSKIWSNREKEAEEEEYFNASDEEEKPAITLQLPTSFVGKRKRGNAVTTSSPIKRSTNPSPGGSKGKGGFKYGKNSKESKGKENAEDNSASPSGSNNGKRKAAGAGAALGLDYEDNSDSEGSSSGGQSPRLDPMKHKQEDSVMTPTAELEEDLGDVAAKMRQKRQREEAEEEGFGGLLMKAGPVGGDSSNSTIKKGKSPPPRETTGKSDTPAEQSPTPKKSKWSFSLGGGNKSQSTTSNNEPEGGKEGKEKIVLNIPLKKFSKGSESEGEKAGTETESAQKDGEGDQPDQAGTSDSQV